jgi:hypothetical protein
MDKLSAPVLQEQLMFFISYSCGVQLTLLTIAMAAQALAVLLSEFSNPRL